MATSNRKRHTRKQRRKYNMKQKHGRNAAPIHTRIGGRTGASMRNKGGLAGSVRA